MNKIFWVIAGLGALLGLSLQISCRESRLRSARGIIEQAESTVRAPAVRSPAMKSADSPLASSSPVAPLLVNAVTDTFSFSAKSSTGEIFKAFHHRRQDVREAVDRKFVPTVADPSELTDQDFESLQPLFRESHCWHFRIQCVNTATPQTLSLGFSGTDKNGLVTAQDIDLASRADDVTYLLFHSDGRPRSGPEPGRQYLLYDDSFSDQNLCDSYVYLALRIPLSSSEPLWFAGFNANTGKWEAIPSSALVNYATTRPIQYGPREDAHFFSQCYAGD